MGAKKELRFVFQWSIFNTFLYHFFIIILDRFLRSLRKHLVLFRACKRHLPYIGMAMLGNEEHLRPLS